MAKRIIPNKQSPGLILLQIEQNLKSMGEIRDIRNYSARWLDHIRRQGFEDLLEAINTYPRDRGFDVLTLKDFSGAEIYPDFLTSEIYREKHTLPPLSFGVSIPKSQWSSVMKKLRIGQASKGIAFDEYLFEERELGLHRTGITLHVEEEEGCGKEYEQLYRDINLYSKTFSFCEKLTMEKLNPPGFATILPYRVFRDLCAMRVDIHSPEELVRYLKHKVDNHIGTFVDGVRVQGAPQDICDEIRRMATLTKPSLLERIPTAVESIYETEEILGAPMLTPLLFGLGPIEQRRQYFIHSPLESLSNISGYLRKQEISEEEIRENIAKKGYIPKCDVN